MTGKDINSVNMTLLKKRIRRLSSAMYRLETLSKDILFEVDSDYEGEEDQEEEKPEGVSGSQPGLSEDRVTTHLVKKNSLIFP